MKLNLFISVAALVGLVAILPARAQSNEDPVLNLMVRKGLISQAEADKARAEEKQDEEKTPASTLIQLQNKSIQKLVFYGDGRLRFENIDQKITTRLSLSPIASVIAFVSALIIFTRTTSRAVSSWNPPRRMIRPTRALAVSLPNRASTSAAFTSSISRSTG